MGPPVPQAFRLSLGETENRQVNKENMCVGWEEHQGDKNSRWWWRGAKCHRETWGQLQR